MKSIILIILTVIAIIITACTQREIIGSDNISTFDECVSAGNPVMESYPRQCKADGKTFAEDIKDSSADSSTECRPEQRNAEVCTALYQPVCARVNVQCIRAPCNPIRETFSNSCEACKNPLVESYIEGGC